MDLIGRVTNHTHAGLFVVICDSKATFPGWDVLGDYLADEGSTPVSLGELAGFVVEGDARYGGDVKLYRGKDGVLWLAPPAEPGAPVLAADKIETEARTNVVEMGFIDAPSGTLTIALAYPPLNMEAEGDHKGITHGEDERLDLAVEATRFALTAENTPAGQILALRPAV